MKSLPFYATMLAVGESGMRRFRMDENVTENKMGVMPVNKLIVTMSVPMMVSNLVQALYNIVDSIFVSRIDENALTAVSLAFPMQLLLIALAIGTGVGINASLSRYLGAGEKEKASSVAMNGLFLALCSYIVFLIIGLTCVDPFYRFQTDDPVILEYGHQYLTWVCALSFGLFGQITLERLLQSVGMTFEAMITQITGAVINMIFDPILIFGLLGFPKMGVKGAAIATVFGQIVAAILALIINIRKNHEIDITLKGFKPNRHIIGRIYGVGMPSIVMQSIGSVMNYCMNLILISFTSTAVAVFGVYYKLQSFIFMPVFGLNNGLIPIVAYNYGANNRKRVVKTIKLTAIYAVVIMIVGVVIFETIPGPLFMIFDASENMLAIGTTALRIIAVHFPIAAVCIVLGSAFQALGNGVYSLVVSIARQLVVLLPAAYLLSRLGSVDYVWWSFPIAEGMSLFATLFFFIRINRNVIKNIPEGSE